MTKMQLENVATAPDRNPINRKPLTLSPSMRAIAARAAAAQPHMTTAVSNVYEWRRLADRQDGAR